MRFSISILCMVAVISAGCSTASKKHDKRSHHAKTEQQEKSELQIFSVEDEFTQFWDQAKDEEFDKQLELWNELVEKPNHQLYHYAVWEKQTHAGWAELKSFELRKRFDLYRQIFEPTMDAFDRFPATLTKQIARLKKVVPNFEAKFPIYAVVAPNFDAKSALVGPGPDSVALVVALDSVTLENATENILYPHELFHAYHATQSGFLNDGVMPRTSILVPLWAEGLATYVSGLANPGVPDADLLFDQRFDKFPREDLRWLARKFLEEKDAHTLSASGPTEAFKRWFNVGGKAPLREDLPDRCGYFLGLRVVRRIAKDNSLKKMTSWKPDQIQKRVIKALKEIEKSH